jgi:hypothetical protein
MGAECDLLHAAMIYAMSSGFGARRGQAGSQRGGRNEISPVAGSSRGSDLAVVPEIDHRIGERLERVMQPTDALKAQL